MLRTRIFRATEEDARIPQGQRLYVVGDIHGRLDLLDRLLKRIDADYDASPIAEPTLLMLGDYIDRGPESRGVIERLVELKEDGLTVCLKGNHEAVLLQFLANPASLEEWGQFGGLNTLMSYGLKPNVKMQAGESAALAKALRSAMPDSHLQFLLGLPTSFTCGDYFFVHAGIRPGVPLAKQIDDDLMWIRDEFLLHEGRLEKFVVHGHTPVKEPDVRKYRINIDTGAYATGRLTCLVLEGDERRIL